MDALQLYQQDPAAVLDDLLRNDPRLRSDHTRKAYRTGVQAFNAWRGDRVVSKTLLRQYMAEMQQQGRAASTINVHLSAVKWYCRTVSDLAQDFASEDPHTDELAKRAARVVTVSALKTDRGKAGRYVSIEEVQLLLAACKRDKSLAGLRDASIISMFWQTGLRRAEVAALELSDLKKTDDGYEIAVQHAKGDKAVTSFVFGGAARYLADYLAARGDAEGRLYLPYDKGSKGQGRPKGMTTAALHYMLTRRCDEAHLDERMSCHDLRRTFCSNLWAGGVDGATVMRLMHHSTLTMSSYYDRRPIEAQRAAARTLNCPYIK